MDEIKEETWTQDTPARPVATSSRITAVQTGNLIRLDLAKAELSTPGLLPSSSAAAAAVPLLNFTLGPRASILPNQRPRSRSRSPVGTHAQQQQRKSNRKEPKLVISLSIFRFPTKEKLHTYFSQFGSIMLIEMFSKRAHIYFTNSVEAFHKCITIPNLVESTTMKLCSVTRQDGRTSTVSTFSTISKDILESKIRMALSGVVDTNKRIQFDPDHVPKIIETTQAEIDSLTKLADSFISPDDAEKMALVECAVVKLKEYVIKLSAYCRRAKHLKSITSPTSPRANVQIEWIKIEDED